MNKELNLFGEVLQIKDIEYIYDSLSSIQSNDKLSDVIDLLDEDLLQIKYLNGTTVDVGWYPSFEESGCFKIMVVKQGDWENPVYLSNLEFNPKKLLEEIKVAMTKS